MRPGGGKGKGSGFERVVCKALSKWVTNGKHTDGIFWRSSNSGGRATVQHRKGVNIRQSGDILATAPEGHVLTDKWFVECKFVRDLSLASFLLANQGSLAKFWQVAQQEARKHRRSPMIIAKQNHGTVIVITNIGRLEMYTAAQLTSHARSCDISLFDDMLLGEF